MRIFPTSGKGKDMVILLEGKDNAAMVKIIEDFLATKPNKQSAAYKMAAQLDDELFV